MTSGEWIGIGIPVFFVACVWFTSMFQTLLSEVHLMLAELRGINAKLGRIEEQQKSKP
jgi:hypothetical protein